MNWEKKLTRFDRVLLGELCYSGLPTDHNPITEALEDHRFVEDFGHLKGFNRTSLSKLATLCQMAVFDQAGGPEGDNKLKALRRHWYSWYKTKFAQPLSEQLGEDLQSERWGLNWSARLSQTYSYFVDSWGVTYQDLWVDDASRMMQSIHKTLFEGCHIIIAVEKDSLFSDFVAPAKALGATTVYSGKGKSSKAAIEKVLREHFCWTPNSPQFDSLYPLIILHITDYDFDGEAVIGPTFAEQARRYTPFVLEARVGIQPSDVVNLNHDLQHKWYQIKISNRGYENWAEDKALFLNDWGLVEQGCVGFDRTLHTAYGLEVEALKTRDYYGLLVEALLTVLPFDYIVEKLRDECVADHAIAANILLNEIINENQSYLDLLNEFSRLEQIKQEFEDQVQGDFLELGAPLIDDWRHLEDDPTPNDYKIYVEHASDYSIPWNPFNSRLRTDALVIHLKESNETTIQEYKDTEIDF